MGKYGNPMAMLLAGTKYCNCFYWSTDYGDILPEYLWVQYSTDEPLFLEGRGKNTGKRYDTPRCDAGTACFWWVYQHDFDARGVLLL